MEMMICSGPFGMSPNGSLLTFSVCLGAGFCHGLILADAGADPSATVRAVARPKAQTLPMSALPARCRVKTAPSRRALSVLKSILPALLYPQPTELVIRPRI